MDPLFNTVLIAGVGLIGGSVALGLKTRGLATKIIGYDVNPENLNTALSLGVIDEAQQTLGKWLAEVDVVVLAVPVGVLVSLAEKMMHYTKPETLFTDVGSVKAPITYALENMPNFVPGHPMAGSEKAGVGYAKSTLLENAVWLLTPSPNTPIIAVKKIRTLVEALGAKPVVMPPEAHDQFVATVSHLPYLTALALTHMVSRDERLALLAAGGFRDLTRVASGDPRMSRDMVVNNRHALKDALGRFRIELEHLEKQLEEPEMLLESAEEGKRTRDSLPIVKRSLLPPLYDLMVTMPDQPKQFAIITGALGDADINIKDIEVLAIRDQASAIRLGFQTLEEVQAAKEVLSNIGYEVRVRM